MKVAIMQPYLFPYVGYFQLVNSVDIFVFYDDVNFIKGGWINRNVILNNNKRGFFTLDLIGASSLKKIKEIKVRENKERLLKTLVQCYKKAPYFNEVMVLVEGSFSSENSYISDVAEKSVINVSQYLGLRTKFASSSDTVPHNDNKLKEERLIKICKFFSGDIYVNMVSGKDLYSLQEFEKNNITIKFLTPDITPYKQFIGAFKPNLSVIDVLMFNSKDEAKELICKYSLE